MDDHRFDQLARSLAAGTSRRAVLKRLAGTIVGTTLGLGGLRRVGAQDAESDDPDIQVGTGGHADGGSGGGSVATGDISTGGNSGNVTTIGDVASGDGDATVVVDGGEVTTSTDIALSADGGSTTVSANGGSNNTVTITAEVQASPPPAVVAPPPPPPPPPTDGCAGVTCPVCQACDPATGTCAAADEGLACGPVDLCTTGGPTCVAGTCRTGPMGPVGCPAPPNECFDAGTCDPLTGLCSPPVYAGDGAECSDGVCFNQACCTPQPDENFCTVGLCSRPTNNCGQTVVCGCTDRQTCSGGTCCGAIYESCDPASVDPNECCNASTCKAVDGANVCCGVANVSPCNAATAARCCSGVCNTNGLCATGSLIPF